MISSGDNMDGSGVKRVKVDYVKVRALANKMGGMPGFLDVTAIMRRCEALDMPCAMLPVIVSLERQGWRLDSTTAAKFMCKSKDVDELGVPIVDHILSNIDADLFKNATKANNKGMVSSSSKIWFLNYLDRQSETRRMTNSGAFGGRPWTCLCHIEELADRVGITVNDAIRITLEHGFKPAKLNGHKVFVNSEGKT